MKIKLKNLLNAFLGIRGCYDACEFSRVVALMPHYREVKDIVTLYEDHKKILEEELQKGTNKEGNLTGKQIMAHNDKLQLLLNEEIEIKAPPKFTVEEVKKAVTNGVTGSQYEAMEPYFIIKKSEK